MSLTPGLRADVRLVVAEADTAVAMGSGDVPVLATPRLLALAEAATVAAVRDHLDRGTTSVGTSVALTHTAPTPVGTSVTAHARLVEVDGHRLVFEVEADDEATSVGSGRVERAVVDRRRFLSGLDRQDPP